jgi:hypothetical protein
MIITNSQIALSPYKLYKIFFYEDSFMYLNLKVLIFLYIFSSLSINKVWVLFKYISSLNNFKFNIQKIFIKSVIFIRFRYRQPVLKKESLSNIYHDYVVKKRYLFHWNNYGDLIKWRCYLKHFIIRTSINGIYNE